MTAPGELVWPNPETLAANAVGLLAPGQRESLLGGPIRPPYVGLAIVAAALPAGAVAWWTVELGLGVAVAIIVANVGLVAMAMNLDRRRRHRRLRGDLDEPLIGNGIGEVVADPRGGVEIRAAMIRVEQVLEAKARLPPGWYHLYWLEHPRAQSWNADRVLLSARLIEPADPGRGHSAASAAHVGAALTRALGFTEEDLRYNRAGAPSPSQRAKLRRISAPAAVSHTTGTATAVVIDASEDDWILTVGDSPAFRVSSAAARAFFTPGQYTVHYHREGRKSRLLSAEPVVDKSHAAVIAWPQPDPSADAALDAARRDRLGGRWTHTMLLAMVPAVIAVAAVAVPYVIHRYAPRRIAVGDGTELKITLIVVAIYVTAWIIAGLVRTARRRRKAK